MRRSGMLARHILRRSACAMAAIALTSLASGAVNAQSVSDDASDIEAAAQARLDEALATNQFAVIAAKIDAGLLKITGTTKGKRKEVVLDGTYTTKSDGNRVFTFELAYLPASCVAKLKAQGDKLSAAVKFCTPSGPQGDRGDRGKRGAVGKTGAIGPQGPEGETGAKGKKGKKGDTGPAGIAGATGPKGAAKLYRIGGSASDIPATAGAVGFIGPTQTIDFNVGDFVAGSISAYAKLASGSGPDILRTFICGRLVSQPTIFPITDPGENQVTDTLSYVGQTMTGQFSTAGAHLEIGLCYETTTPSAAVEIGTIDGWFNVFQVEQQ